MASAIGKARRLARGLAVDRTRYPALRLEPSTARAPADALAALGFARPQIEAAERDYEAAARDLFPKLLERAREAGAELQAGKLEQPRLPAHEAKRLLYTAIRVLEPEMVVETGTFAGTFSAFSLAALRDNGRGRLISHDLPAYEPIPNATDVALPPGREPGWIIPDELRDRLELVLGDARQTLPRTLRRVGGIDLFLHDSLHTTRHMLFEFRVAWAHLRPGGLLLSDDAFWNGAWWWFTRRHRVPFLHVGAVGVTRKPLRS
jgi:predicted O-methyltransferase YrrM